MLRFQNPHAQRPTTGEFKDDPAHLVRPILNALLKQCGLAFLLGPEFSLDEIDIGYQVFSCASGGDMHTLVLRAYIEKYFFIDSYLSITFSLLMELCVFYLFLCHHQGKN